MLSWRKKEGRVSRWHGPKEIDENYKEGKLLMEENIKLGFYHAKGKMIESPTAYPVEVACGRFC